MSHDSEMNLAESHDPLTGAAPAPNSATPVFNVEPGPEDSPALQALAQAVHAISGLAAAQTTFATNQQVIQEAIAHLMASMQTPGTIRASVPPGSIRFRDPRTFNGTPAAVKPFLTDLRNAIHLQRRSLVTDFDKSIYMSTWLEDGSPKSWFWAIEKTQPDLLNHHEDLIEDFRKHFGDSDFINSQMTKIENLKQRASASKYASAFREIMVHLPITDDIIKINMFRKGLKDDVRALFVTITEPKIFDQYVEQAITFDNRLHARAQELGTNRKHLTAFLPVPVTTSHAATPATPSSSTNGPVPMEVDAVRHHGPLTDAEKQRRRDNNLCAYCGGKHKVDDCPTLAKRNEKGNPTSGKAKPVAH